MSEQPIPQPVFILSAWADGEVTKAEPATETEEQS